MDQLPLQNIVVPTQMRASLGTGVIAMRKAAFQQFATPSQ